MQQGGYGRRKVSLLQQEKTQLMDRRWNSCWKPYNSVAVIYCPAHAKDNSETAKGNALADRAAKAAARQVFLEAAAAFPADWPEVINPAKLYVNVPNKKIKDWKNWKAKRTEDEIWTLQGKPILPCRYLLPVARWFHE